MHIIIACCVWRRIFRHHVFNIHKIRMRNRARSVEGGPESFSPSHVIASLSTFLPVFCSWSLSRDAAIILPNTSHVHLVYSCHTASHFSPQKQYISTLAQKALSHQNSQIRPVTDSDGDDGAYILISRIIHRASETSIHWASIGRHAQQAKASCGDVKQGKETKAEACNRAIAQAYYREGNGMKWTCNQIFDRIGFFGIKSKFNSRLLF